MGQLFGLMSFIPGHGGSSRLTPLELSKIIAFPANVFFKKLLHNLHSFCKKIYLMWQSDSLLSMKCPFVIFDVYIDWQPFVFQGLENDPNISSQK